MTSQDCPRCKSARPDAKIFKCLACRRCRTHGLCRCRRCEYCSKRKPPKDFCTACTARERSGCLDCHEGLASGLPLAAFPYRRCQLKGNPLTPSPTFERNRLRRSIGVEVELASWGNLSTNGYRTGINALPTFGASFVHDGSVTPSGMEAVSKVLCGDQVLVAMAEFAEAVHNAKASANESCGVHVHVDAADLNMFSLRRVALGWNFLEHQLIGTLVAPHRARAQANGINYCAPLAFTPATLTELLSFKASGDISDWLTRYLYGIYKEDYTTGLDYDYAVKAKRAHKYENAARRKSLNFHSWMMRGTLEFRLKEGTTDPGDLLWWPVWCGWLIEYLQGATDAEVLQWQDNPPELVELTRRFHPSLEKLGLVAWVESKCKPPEPKPKRATRKASVEVEF